MKANELNKAAEEYAQDETMSGLAERAFKAGAEWQREQYECIPAEEEYMRGFAQGAKEERERMREDIIKMRDTAEQPAPTCKSCGFYENNCPFIRDTFKPYPNKVCKDYTYSVMKTQEQPEVDLEKEMDKQIRSTFYDLDGIAIIGTSEYASVEDMEYIARHFYELGQRTKYQQDREEFAKLKVKEWQSGYDEGYAKGLNARKEE